MKNFFKKRFKEYKTIDGFIYRYDPVTLLPVKNKRWFKWWFMLFMVISLMGISKPVGTNKYLGKYDITIITKPVPILTEQSLRDSLVSNNIYFPDIVLKQMKIESGNFNSNIFIHTNNLMGMTYPIMSRKTTALSSYNGFAVYDSWVSSVKDYALFQKTFFNHKYYFKFLKDVGYASDSNYINKLAN